MKRRNFVKQTALAGVGSLLMPGLLKGRDVKLSGSQGELLYNGIRLPAVWPPRKRNLLDISPMRVPYLSSPPDVIPIDIGRQLFVDDFLIESTTLKRVFHKAKKIDNNPILIPETAIEKDTDCPLACPKDGGVWWDAKDQVFKMWYEAGWVRAMAYATSKDGIAWERPDLDIEKGTNRIIPEYTPDTTTVFIDYDAKNPEERFKIFFRPVEKNAPGLCMVSADGIHWSKPAETGYCGDKSTAFYNPFRKKWVFSIRSSSNGRRLRFYREHADFMNVENWREDMVYWTAADNLDMPDPNIGDAPQLYNLSAVAYESLILGFHQIHLGPHNDVCAATGEPKITELMVSFSRDGFHWDRGDRKAFINATRRPGDWDRGYVEPVGGICTVVGDELRFYYIGFKGDQEKKTGKRRMYANGSTGIAVLRRDGFASMEAGEDSGVLTTRTVVFDGKRLFVNVDCPNGELKAELLDEHNKVIAPYTSANCLPVAVNSTIYGIEWKGGRDLSQLTGKKVKLRFRLRNGKLYSFWVSKSSDGASNGYVAAGGPGYITNLDDKGILAYQQAQPYSKLMYI